MSAQRSEWSDEYEASLPLEGDLPAQLPHRRLRDLTDEPARIIAFLRHKHSTKSYTTDHPVCLRCGHTEDLNPTRGLCAGCNPVIEPWRKWRPADGPPPYYHPE